MPLLVAQLKSLADLMFTPPIFCAIDRPDLDGANALAGRLAGYVGGFKLGLEFFIANGPPAVRTIQAHGAPIFLDLKLHDIPNTVAGAVRSVAAMNVNMLTIHAAGGRAMLEAAVSASQTTPGGPLLLGVTVLTSLDDADLADCGVPDGVADQALRLAELAQACGLGGLVCSPHELARLRPAVDPGFCLVVPGIRPVDAGGDDQKRTMTPGDAIVGGADMLVVGRPITTAADPVAVARAVAAETMDRSAA